MNSTRWGAIVCVLWLATGCDGGVAPGVDSGGMMTDAGDGCASGPEDGRTACGDGCDNDGDGRVDCADDECAGVGSCPATCPAGAESTAAFCADLCDNDGDGRVDCADSQCAGIGSCPRPCPTGAESSVAFCADSCDNDGDGLVDCADDGCAGVGSCPSTCPSGAESSAAYCADSCDNDGDGLVDCADSQCAGIGSCPPAPVCTPGQRECSGSGGIRTCDSSGFWGLTTSCSFGCNMIGGDHCNECTPSTRTCNAAGNVSVCGADGRLSTETCTRGCSGGTCIGPRTVTIINDLYNLVAGPNDWSQLNQIHRVRFGPTETGVRTSSAGERLPTYLDVIRPGGAGCSGGVCTETFNTDALGTDYWLFIQNGWWEYFCAGGCSWVRHDSEVVCCDCASTCQKWVTIHITGHIGGDNVVRASDFLPPANWCRAGPPYC